MKQRVGVILGALAALLTIGALGAQGAHALYWESAPVAGKKAAVATSGGPLFSEAIVGVLPEGGGTVDAAVIVQCTGNGIGTASSVRVGYAVSANTPTYLPPVSPLPMGCPTLP